jgi:hypothetical protein
MRWENKRFWNDSGMSSPNFMIYYVCKCYDIVVHSVN